MNRILVLFAMTMAFSLAQAAPKPSETLKTTVQWRMSLDAQGHVTALDPQGKAIDAIREKLEPVVRAWDFEPGAINGNPAATETMLSVQISMLPSADSETYSIRFDDVRTGGFVRASENSPRFTQSSAASVLRDGGFARLVFEVSYDKAGMPQAVAVQAGSTLQKGRLIDDAEKALEKWTFEPERVAGIGVPGKVIVPICYYVGLSRRDAEKSGRSCLWTQPGTKATVGEGQSLAVDSSVSLKSDVIGRTL